MTPARHVLLLLLLMGSIPGPAQAADSVRRVDIGGGRRIHLECRGTGSPTVVLVAGLKASADDWKLAGKPGPTVYAAVGRFTRVCAYDRPGTPVGEQPSRSDPVRQPTTAAHAVADLHALLGAAKEPAPYVLVGHSYGGLIAKLYARDHPREVSGLVLVDALSEGLQEAETPAQWKTQRILMEGDLRESLALYPDLERIDPDRSFDQVRAAPPLRPLPLIVLSADRPWGPQVPELIAAGVLPADVPPDSGYVTDAAQKQAQERLAKLVPGAKHIVDTNSGHEVHKEQPQLVIDSIEEVVAAARDPGRWGRKIFPEGRGIGAPTVVGAAGKGHGAGHANAIPEPADPVHAALDPISRAALDKALDAGFAASGMPGVTVGVWIPGRGSWVASRGVADRRTGRPMTDDLQAPIGSITKTFTMMIALQLVGEGRLRLDDALARWYPGVAEASSITVKMLLNHTSGIADIGQQQVDLHCADPYRSVSPDELIAIGVALPRAPFAPGKGFLYSSTNTIILGRILEKVAGREFAALIGERLLEPLALDRTKLDTDGRLDPPFSRGYTDFCPRLPALTDTTQWPQFSFAAGALASTVHDLHLWGRALGRGFGLTPALRQARIDDELGIAVQRDPRTGKTISFGHAGAEMGYVANVQYYPCTDAVWALMGNGDGGTGEVFIAVLKALQPVVEPLAAPPAKCSG